MRMHKPRGDSRKKFHSMLNPFHVSDAMYFALAQVLDETGMTYSEAMRLAVSEFCNARGKKCESPKE